MLTEAEIQLAKLIAMPTISDDTAANDMALDYIEKYVARRGMFCRRDRFDGHGTLLASSRKERLLTPKVLLAAHVDVMPGSQSLFALRKKDGLLLGRGVYDMKFSIAGYLQIIDELSSKNKLADYDLGLLITTDEEYGGRDGINGTDKLIKAGLKPEICILPDSTAPGWEVQKVAKGYWRFDVVAKGRTAHGSRPWEGDSATIKLIQGLHKIQDAFKNHGPLTDTLNIGKINGGEAYNIIPHYVTAGVEIRLASEDGYHRTRALVEQICQEHDLTYQDRAFSLPNHTDILHPHIQSYSDSVEKITGKRPVGFVSCGQSDQPYFAAIGTTCIVTCPEGGKHHSEEEWISHKSFLHFMPILHDYLEKTAKNPIKVVDREVTLV